MAIGNRLSLTEREFEYLVQLKRILKSDQSAASLKFLHLSSVCHRSGRFFISVIVGKIKIESVFSFSYSAACLNRDVYLF